ncbi:unnamed protein product [Staurois parvus]|uniref:Uncharacterized protein n=1 Tax=Staurois parvus TaxID=386267 RepID=A0ABN9D348_9NEOB|nr:unnamed protein product [Staurois parvus]
MLTPSCPVPLVQCQCFFFSTDHCIGVTGDVRSPQCQNAHQFQNARYSPAISC